MDLWATEGPLWNALDINIFNHTLPTYMYNYVG